MHWIVVIVIGGLVGWVASIMMRTNAQMGLLANILVGIVGSALGFWIAGALGLGASGDVLRFLIAVAGAALLIFLLQALGVFRRA